MTPDPSNSRPADMSSARRLVVKIGSAVLAPEGRLDPANVGRIARELAALRRDGRQVVVVSSGAVASGFRSLGLERMPVTIRQKQAAAALGQHRLMRAWGDAFASDSIEVAQVLLTDDDMDDRTRFLNARHTLDALLEAGAIPIVNENDSVAFDEIRLGDNDRLSALVAHLIDADLLVVLSVADGVRSDGGKGDVVPYFADPTHALEHVGDSRTDTGVGGMATKIAAAQAAGASGVPTIIAPGAEREVLTRLLTGDPIGTYLAPGAQSAASRKRWIGYSTRPRGSLVLDDGAVRALCERGASLLPGGIECVEGTFESGAPVDLKSASGKAFARGLVSYSSSEIDRIRGAKSSEIESRLGYAYSLEVIHRDDLFLFERGSA